MADYTCQAIVSSLIFSAFPTDSIIGEEDSTELHTPENVETKAQIVRLANEAMVESLSAPEEGEWKDVKSVKRGEKEWLEIIDRGNSLGGAKGREYLLFWSTKGLLFCRAWSSLLPCIQVHATDLISSLKGHWALDPIDGTKGFLRGGQYAVCLGLLVDGQVEVGVMGCPNLPVNPKEPEGEKGVIFVAVKGQGAFQVSLKFCEWYFSDVEVY